MRDIKDELKAAIDAFNFQPGSMVYEAYNEIISLRHKVSPASGGLEAVREAAEQVRYHWEVIQGQCSEGDGFTERAATDLELAIVGLEAALAAPATPAGASGEGPVAWMIQYENGRRSFYLCEQLALPPGHKQTPLYTHPRPEEDQRNG